MTTNRIGRRIAGSAMTGMVLVATSGWDANARKAFGNSFATLIDAFDSFTGRGAAVAVNAGILNVTL